ncbi:hypothetical protein [Bradyrhizobium sp. SZCCHNRI2049]|uniref:hypothetical protein n=1 Tax=Bradyrhizobium sp. SZCCHNRI2049 TaxID=3057287 RepID=UPI002916C437|nr:hypothetical protein [Bradyrhizobium sp. SZCCHNRI2049]
MAIAFIDRMYLHPEFFATLDDDGHAVIEFRNREIGFFADLTFHRDGTVTAYRREPGKVSVESSGFAASEEMISFLKKELRVEMV